MTAKTPPPIPDANTSEELTPAQIVGKWFRLGRKAVKLSQFEVADAAKIGRVTYSIYERGKRTPDLETFIRICGLLYLPTTEIIKEIEGEL